MEELMEFHINDKIHGFTVGRVRELKDCEGTLIEMKHNQSGCDLIYLMREDENSTFSIAFKTIPSDDTGVFHILEHSVLNGSRKYPVKEPFVELLKSSLQTFLNAMTYPDKTMYPVSSRNEKDFLNLMDVYLDAVFFPAIYHNKNIFLQEGWHYEVDEEDKLSYKGVVYSEMKGAFSSVDEVMMNELNKMLFKDTCYQYESGGDPKAITDLTYEQFLETHRKFYHPSNATIFLDGQIDLDKALDKINSYLSLFDREEITFDIPEQSLLPREDKTCSYAIEQEEDESNKTHITFSKIGCSYRDIEKIIAWDALSDLLVGSNEAPLKKAILESNLGQDVEFDIMTGIQQPILVLTVRNTEEKNRDAIRQKMTDVAIKVLDEGINEDKIIASLNMMEFKYREKSEPAGVMNADNALKSALYGGDPTIYLDRGDVYGLLREKVKKGYFENLLKEFFFDHEHVSSLALVPSKTLEEERKVEEEKKLEKLQKEIDLETLKKENETLLAWQEKPDTLDTLACLPKLTLEDVSKTPRPFEPEVKEINGIPVLVYPEQTKGIVYFSLYFNLAGLKIDKLSSLTLFSSLLGDLATKYHSVEELSQEIRANIGSLSISTTAVQRFDDRGLAVPMLVVNCATLKEDLEKTVSIVQEILLDTTFTKEEIKPLIAQYVETARQSLIGAGHAVALNTVSAQYSASGAALEYISGFKSMKWLYEFNKNFEERIEDFIIDCNLYRNVVFTSSRLTVSVTEEENYSTIQNFIEELPRGEFERCAVRYPLAEKRNVGILIPAQVSYCVIGSKLEEETYHASETVLGQILTYEYLWNEVRVKQGAYGTGFVATTMNTVNAYSYRDPSPTQTIETAKKIEPFAKDFLEKHEDLTSYIIGVIAAQEPLVSPRGNIRSANSRYFAGVDYETRKRIREEILNTEAVSIRKNAKNFQEAMENGTYCIVGNEEALKKSNISKENILKFEE